MTASWQSSPRAHSIATSGTDAGASKAGAVYSIAVSTRVSAISMAILWLVHWPPRGRALVSTWKELLAVCHQGLARAVGVSNYRPAQLDKLIDAWLAGWPAVHRL